MREIFENEWFPKAYAMGVSWSDFWNMNPHIINLLIKGHQEKIEMQMKIQDRLNWYLGQYFASALDCTVCNSELWRKMGTAPHSYIEKPILQDQRVRAELTEEEKKREVDLFFAKENARRINWKRNRGSGSA